MKKMVIVFSLIIVVSLMVTSNIMALSFINVEGFVSPGVGSVNSDGTKTFPQVDYSFKVTDTLWGFEMDWLNLKFPKDVYQKVGAISDISHDWSTMSGSNLFNTNFYVSAWPGWAGTPVGVNETLAFSVMDVTVLDSSMWKGSHEPWIQSFLWSDTFPIPITYDHDTTTHTPEPGTFLLLGSGLAGVVAYVRKKKCLLNI